MCASHRARPAWGPPLSPSGSTRGWVRRTCSPALSEPSRRGPQTAARLLLTGDTVKGDEAQQLGMVAEAVSPEEVVPRATALAGRMAAQGPVAVRSCVRTLRLAMDEGLDRALWREADAQSYCYKSSDLGEGVAAVKEKRSPQFADYSSYAFCRPPGDGHPPSAP
eukprot:TRINITY_DN31937_c0_g1_i1.p6 TRINITY_DN31937_c0_g1~~TRINITY_DN31937_c0_g1_i1.p6  ORF type:complete len:165 (+),score=32.53 TRINITY_DN31937_c0_g1_i1:499-993(+)